MIFYFQLAVSLLLGLIVFILEVIVILCLELYIVRQNRQRARMVGHLACILGNKAQYFKKYAIRSIFKDLFAGCCFFGRSMEAVGPDSTEIVQFIFALAETGDRVESKRGSLRNSCCEVEKQED